VTETEAAPSWLRAPAGWGVGVLLVFTIVALVGYGVFGKNPQLIPPSLIGFWQVSYAFFAKVHIVLGAAVLAAALLPWAGLRWIPALVAVYLLSLAAEYVGTGWGLPFGDYSYTTLLGAKIGDRVPWVIPLSWFLMALPAWILARQTFPLPGRHPARILFAAVILTLWDLALDPAMAYGAPYYWTWGETGPYYGMPWLNLFGWVATGMVLMGAMELLRIGDWGRRIPVGWAFAYYAVTLFMPFGMLVLDGLWLAVGVTLAACGAAWGFHRAVARRAPSGVPGGGGPVIPSSAGAAAGGGP
jgi:uncharacterized membrane protein